MSAVDGGSVPPPGWGESNKAVANPLTVDDGAGTVSVSSFASVPRTLSGQPAAEAALEWRMNAAIIDALLLTAVYGLICLVLHWRFLTLTHELVALAINCVYYFALESRHGQTVGKRISGVRVVAVDGSAAGPKAIAIRSILRFIDALPVMYLSGLINVVRTGPERRQRIGDVAAETKVIAVGGDALTRGTRGWVLPTVTVLALILSAANVIAIANAGNQPLTSDQQAQFVSNCANGTHGLVDCQCLLNRLEADGYTSANDINTLVAQARSEELAGQTGTARTEVVNDTLACRQ
jgi:uncharacterized RDD family membrane protein YckC